MLPPIAATTAGDVGGKAEQAEADVLLPQQRESREAHQSSRSPRHQSVEGTEQAGRAQRLRMEFEEVGVTDCWIEQVERREQQREPGILERSKGNAIDNRGPQGQPHTLHDQEQDGVSKHRIEQGDRVDQE